MRVAPLLTVLLIACQAEGPSWRLGGDGDNDYEYVPPTHGGADVNVVEREDPEAVWDCADDPEGCTDDYLAIPAQAAAWADPIDAGVLEASIDAILDGDVAVYGADEVSDAAVDSAVDRALNMDFLRSGLDDRALEVTWIGAWQRDGYTERHLILDDPWVGSFFGILLLPDGAETDPVPGVLSVHGHGQQAGDVLDDLFGTAYPAHGYALLTFTFRGMGADEHEDEAARALLLEGFTLEAMRIYESLLALKLLRWLPQVDAERLAVVGHSGGSVAWNLGVRQNPPIRALVTDLQGTYCDLWKGLVLDDTIPDLYPYHPAINELSGTGVAALVVDYSYQDELDEILDFLDQWIGG